MESRFYTQKAYIKKAELSASKEDYLEMIFRVCRDNGYARISDIADKLNVGTSSASKMAAVLKESGLIAYEKYGIITLTDEGRIKGRYLLKRHDILNDFFCFINDSESETSLTEQIEHYIDEETVRNIEKLMVRLRE